ncbi:MAG: class I mannose-6-phosphate isomerase [Clostridia bacterium]|nr:class I mannose-6-phosphate isomerase [Clostridia bacterium]
MYPFLLTAPTKDYVWGGTRLSREYGLDSSKERQAEGWMLSCHKDGESTVANGENKGKALSAVLAAHPEYTGSKGEGKAFPVLIKLIDAKQNLSVQVHPDDEYAMRVEGESGKTEAWYIVDCDEGAQLIYGFKKEISRDEFEQAIKNNTLLDVVNRVSVKKGDLFFIESGTLHAIGEGILLAEIQQSSNTTYRVYDYGRIVDGKPRELHIEKALDVTNRKMPKSTGKPMGEKECFEGFCMTLLTKCEFFTSTDIEISTQYTDSADNTSFVSLLVLDGEGTLEGCGESLEIKKGDSVFIPASSGKFTVSGKLDIIKTVL